MKDKTNFNFILPWNTIWNATVLDLKTALSWIPKVDPLQRPEIHPALGLLLYEVL